MADRGCAAVSDRDSSRGGNHVDSGSVRPGLPRPFTPASFSGLAAVVIWLAWCRAFGFCRRRFSGGAVRRNHEPNALLVAWFSIWGRLRFGHCERADEGHRNGAGTHCENGRIRAAIHRLARAEATERLEAGRMIIACAMLVFAGLHIRSWVVETRVQGESKSQTEYVAEPNLAVPKPIPSPDESSQSRVAYMRTLNVIEGW